ncbi:19763_t:CDS:2, partial [Funneliformis geosporum]
MFKQEDNQMRDNLQQQAGMQEDRYNQTRNNLQQQAEMQRFAKKSYECTSSVVNTIKFIVALISAIVTINYLIQIRN